MIKQFELNGETLINIPADMNTLLELGLTKEQVIAVLNDHDAKNGLNAVRHAREPLLIEADRLVNIALDNNQDITPFRQYRQALRDITNHYQSLDNIVWPQKPSLLPASA